MPGFVFTMASSLFSGDAVPGAEFRSTVLKVVYCQSAFLDRFIYDILGTRSQWLLLRQPEVVIPMLAALDETPEDDGVSISCYMVLKIKTSAIESFIAACRMVQCHAVFGIGVMEQGLSCQSALIRLHNVICHSTISVQVFFDADDRWRRCVRMRSGKRELRHFFSSASTNSLASSAPWSCRWVSRAGLQREACSTGVVLERCHTPKGFEEGSAGC